MPTQNQWFDEMIRSFTLTWNSETILIGPVSFIIIMIILSKWVPSHYLNQCWHIVHLTPRNNFQLNIYQNSYIFIQEMHLTHWDRDKMNAILQMTFPSAFSWMKMYYFRLRFHWNLFVGVQLTIFQYWFRKWLVAVQATSHYLNQWWLVHRHIYASPGLNEFKMLSMKWWPFCLSLNVLTHFRLASLLKYCLYDLLKLWIIHQSGIKCQLNVNHCKAS